MKLSNADYKLLSRILNDGIDAPETLRFTERIRLLRLTRRGLIDWSRSGEKEIEELGDKHAKQSEKDIHRQLQPSALYILFPPAIRYRFICKLLAFLLGASLGLLIRLLCEFLKR